MTVRSFLLLFPAHSGSRQKTKQNQKNETESGCYTLASKSSSAFCIEKKKKKSLTVVRCVLFWIRRSPIRHRQSPPTNRSAPRPPPPAPPLHKGMPRYQPAYPPLLLGASVFHSLATNTNNSTSLDKRCSEHSLKGLACAAGHF